MTGHWECRNSHIVQDKRAKVCPECGSDIGWMVDPSPDSPVTAASRADSDRSAPPAAPWAWILGGLALAVTGALFALNEDSTGVRVVGLLLLGIGVTLNGIGIIAEGVRLGINASIRGGNTPENSQVTKGGVS